PAPRRPAPRSAGGGCRRSTCPPRPCAGSPAPAPRCAAGGRESCSVCRRRSRPFLHRRRAPGLERTHDPPGGERDGEMLAGWATEQMSPGEDRPIRRFEELRPGIDPEHHEKTAAARVASGKLPEHEEDQERGEKLNQRVETKIARPMELARAPEDDAARAYSHQRPQEQESRGHAEPLGDDRRKDGQAPNGPRQTGPE